MIMISKWGSIFRHDLLQPLHLSFCLRPLRQNLIRLPSLVSSVVSIEIEVKTYCDRHCRDLVKAVSFHRRCVRTLDSN